MAPPKTPNDTANSADGKPDRPSKTQGKPVSADKAAASAPAPEAKTEIPAGPAPRPHNYATAAFIGVVVALAALAGAGYATQPLWAPRLAVMLTAPDDPAQAASIAELKARLGALEAKAGKGGTADAAVKDLEAHRARLSKDVDALINRLGGLETEVKSVSRMIEATTRPRDAAAAGKSLKELSERLAQVEQTKDVLRVLDQRGAGIGTSGAVTAEKNRLDELIARNQKITSLLSGLAQKVGALESARPTSGLAQEQRNLIISIERLREILHSSAPFGEELAALESVAENYADLLKIIGDLKPYAAGVPTLAVVQSRFDAATTRIAAAANGASGNGWVERTVSRLSSLVTVRRTDAVAYNTIDGHLARAEASIREGNLIAAVKIIEGLSGAAAEAAAPWLKAARARILAERVLAALHVHAVSLLNTAGE